jgi:flagellar L-ring protein precursor FlgH
MIRFRQKFLSLALVAVMLAGCDTTVDRLNNIGDPPPLREVTNPVEKPGYQPMSWPLPENTPPSKQYAGSLWQPGARSFFRDQRASRVGDIVRVNVQIRDRAMINNNTTRGRTSSEEVETPEILGLGAGLFGLIPGSQNPDNLIGIESESNNRGTGRIQRQEMINTVVAAIVTQILPNGNLVIEGNQEILVNYDVREVGVAGVIRPEDIRADNTINHDQIAQARITYSGRGQISDVHRPRWGNQVIDILSPF